MGHEEPFQPIAAEFMTNLASNPAADAFPLVHYPFAFRVPLIFTAALLIWAILISGVQGNATRERARQPQPVFHAMTLIQK